MFVGRHERQLDSKGRLALPSAFRPRFEPLCYLTFGQDGCIDVLTAEGFGALAAEVIEGVKRGEITRQQQRALAGQAVAVTLDGQGRIMLDRELRQFAGIEPDTKVVVAGSFDRVEIWSLAAYQQQIAEGGAQIKGATEN